MRVDTMQRLDRWLGIPACLTLTGVRHLADLLRGPTSAPVSSIVFVKLAEQGSTVLAADALRRAVTLVGRTNVHFLCFEQNRFILDAMALIPSENVHTVRNESLATVVRDGLAATARLRRLRVAAVVDLEFFARSSAVLGYLIGSPHRVGLHSTRGEGPYRGDLLTHRLRFNPHIHTSRTFRLLVDALAAAPPSFPRSDLRVPTEEFPPPRFTAGEDEVDEVRALLRGVSGGASPRPLVLLNPNCGDLLPLRAWPGSRYVELARRLLQGDDPVWIGFTGAPEEAAAVSDLAERVGSRRCFSLAGRTTLRQLLVGYTLADVLVTNDSGPAHFATLTPIDVITLFGPEHPRLFAARGPRNHVLWAGLACSPCISALNGRATDCRDNRCMQAITVDEVEKAVWQALASRGYRGAGKPGTRRIQGA